jgi:hypothetical protein
VFPRQCHQGGLFHRSRSSLQAAQIQSIHNAKEVSFQKKDHGWWLSNAKGLSVETETVGLGGDDNPDKIGEKDQSSEALWTGLITTIPSFFKLFILQFLPV